MMIEDAPLARVSVYNLPADQTRKLRVAHGLMRAQRHQIVEHPNARGQILFQNAEHHGHWHGSCSIGNQHQHTPIVDRELGEPSGGNFADFAGGKITLVNAVADDG